MVRGASRASSTLPSAPSRKRKWNSTHVTRIDFGDSDSDSKDTSTVVVQQASWDGRRIERSYHSIPMPHDPNAVVESYDYIAADNMDFEMDGVDGDPLDKADDMDTPDHVCSQILPRVS